MLQGMMKRFRPSPPISLLKEGVNSNKKKKKTTTTQQTAKHKTLFGWRENPRRILKT